MISIVRHLPRFREAKRSLAEIAARESWSAAQMRDWQLARLNEIWSAAGARVPYYRELAKLHDLPPRFDSIEHFTGAMPLLSKDALRRRATDFVMPGAGAGAWRATSGSTGLPMRFFTAHETHHRQLRHQYRFRQVWGVDLFDRAAFFGAGAPQATRGIAAGLKRAHEAVTDGLRNRIRLPVHRMSGDDLARQLERIARFRPRYVYGYSRAIHLLALEAARRGFQTDGLRVVMMTSEPAFPHMVAAVERALGAPAVIEYGSMECGVTAYEWTDRTIRVRADRVLVETLPRDDGRFDIVKTVLDNPQFPLLRYRIEDVTDAALSGAGGRDARDEAFPILANIAGRNDDVLYAAGGAAVHPAEIDGIFEASDHAPVRRYRLHQSAAGDVQVKLELVAEAAAATNGHRVDLESIRGSIARAVPGREVRVELVDRIEQTAAGKHRLITSDFRPDGR